MSELIKREDAIEAMAELQGIAQSKAELTGISKAWKRIKVLPTVDAVQVVRCRDCKYYGDEYGSCGRTDIIRSDMRIIMPYWYCADGERKDNENN